MTKHSLVLVIDDDEAILELVQMVLEDEGYTVVTAGDGAEALELLDNHSPDLILLDMRMSRVNGWEFAKAYRRRPERHAPIVVITAAADAARRAAEIGAQGYLGKPFGLDELCSIAARHLSQWPHESAHPRVALPPPRML